MAKQSLSAELAESIQAIKALKEASPHKTINHRLQELYDALHQAQGKEWEEQVEEYQAARQALNDAKRAAREAVEDVSKITDSIDRMTKAVKAVASALSVFA